MVTIRQLVATSFVFPSYLVRISFDTSPTGCKSLIEQLSKKNRIKIGGDTCHIRTGYRVKSNRVRKSVYCGLGFVRLA